ncbi:hypothetical protein PM082_022227 [Marasmius tenuissimus]|nr:hypothetical protein PM082_022227 [Marasmius tenuissimus]
MSNVLTDARDVHIGHNATIHSVTGNLTTTTNTYYNDRGDTVELYGNMFRKILMGDIIVRRDVSSQVLAVVVETKHQESDGGELQQRSKVMRVRKIMQHVEVMGLPGNFTSIAIERLDGTQEGLEIISESVCRELASRRSPLFPQLVGIGQSKSPTWIVHDELANGEEFANKMLSEGSQVVVYYLWYTCATSVFALRGDKTLTIPVLDEWGFWNFNLKTHAWQYDIPSISLSPPNTDISLEAIRYPLTPLRQETPPRLDPTEIIACIENQFNDFLHVIASSGTTSSGVEATYSTSVPSRVDFCSDQPAVNVELHFSWRFLDPLRQRTAYLAQSVPFAFGCRDVSNDLVLIDEVRVSLVGTIPNNSTSSTPIYLFVPPIPIEHTNGVYSIHYPLVSPLFYWSLDPNGKHVISEEDWEMNGIPRLEVLSWIGASWDGVLYWAVEEYLQRQNYDMDGRKYVLEHRYPVLIPGSPFDVRFCNWNESEIGEDWSDASSEDTQHSDHPPSEISRATVTRNGKARMLKYTQKISRVFRRITRRSKAGPAALADVPSTRRTRKDGRKSF